MTPTDLELVPIETTERHGVRYSLQIGEVKLDTPLIDPQMAARGYAKHWRDVLRLQGHRFKTDRKRFYKDAVELGDNHWRVFGA